MVAPSHRLRYSIGREFVHPVSYNDRLTTRHSPTHGYLLNELGIAVIYPNVRGSSGYGRKYMSADDVEKREDAVK
jgi:hypothetical protein